MSQETIHSVGGGLVGALSTILLAQRGYTVSLYERRPDMRRTTVAAGRSINLAVTARGLNALAEAGLRDEVLAIAIPMKGRMLHALDGSTQFAPYGQKPHEVIYSVSRGELNKLFLSKAESFPHVTIAFEQRCTGYDPGTHILRFHDESSQAEHSVIALRILGTDGSGSVLRASLQAHVPGFTQTEDRLEYGYKELVIPPAKTGGFAMEKHALHIWPRKNFMLIALPNRDESFTVTLFYPHTGPESFESLKTEIDIAEFFAREFPDALSLMPGLIDDFFGNPTGAMITVKCAPWHSDGHLMLIGDASHAIVPFFGQGMNCGFEDCTAFARLLDAHTGSWHTLFAQLEKLRKPNSDAIADMAIENFIEMRDTAADARFQFKKQLGFALEQRYPGHFIPRYAMVVFHPEISYAEAKTRGIAQDRILDALSEGIDNLNEIDWARADALMAGYHVTAAA